MSVKTLDSKGRWRNKTVSFRMSPEEASQLDLLVKLSGLTKQEFVIRALLTPTSVFTRRCGCVGQSARRWASS
ncbi:MAG: plasmid mobilization protein [Collinsella sp.]